MSSVDKIAVCIECGEEYWYTFDCRTQESYKTSKCNCKEKTDEDK